MMEKYSFDRPTYQARIKENTPYGQALVRVLYNGIMPVYEILPSASPCWKHFLVQRQSGVVINKVRLNLLWGGVGLNGCGAVEGTPGLRSYRRVISVVQIYGY